MIPPAAPGQNDEKQSMVTWKNTFSMRQISLMNISTATQFTSRNGNKTATRRAYNMIGPVNSLELLRKTLQGAINRDIDSVVKKYLEKFFQPAIHNIRHNLGGECVNDDQIQEICKQMLEEAKVMYKMSRDGSPYECSDSEASLLDRTSPPRKRRGSDTESEPAKRRPGRPAPRREGPKWRPERVTEATFFIMGPRANKVLGYAQTRGRLYARHPELLRYSGDQEDKEWLAARALMPPSGGKAYLMILDDIRELVESDEYRNNANLQLVELRGFQVPPFMINKVRHFMQTAVERDRMQSIGLECFELMVGGANCMSHSNSTTPTNTNIDSGPSTPSDTMLQHLESQPGSSTSSKQSDFINMPEMSPNSNQSMMSGQSPVQNSGLLSPNMLMTIASHSDGSNSLIAIKDNLGNDNSCLSSILTSHLSSDNSEDF